MQICPSDFVPMQFQSWLCPAPALSKLVHSHAFHIELLGGMSGGWVRASTVRTLCTCLHCNGWTARMHKTQHHAPTAVCATQRLVTPQTKTYTHTPSHASRGRPVQPGGEAQYASFWKSQGEPRGSTAPRASCDRHMHQCHHYS